MGSAPIPAPAVERRLTFAREWTTLIASGWRPAFRAGELDGVRPWAERAWHLLQTLAPQLPPRLLPWAAIPLLVQPCLCDIWHDHVLFEATLSAASWTTAASKPITSR